MTIRALRLLTVVAAVLALVAPASGIAGLRNGGSDRGVIQAVDSSQIVLRALDGSVASFAVVPRTRVKLNGVRVSIAALSPGLVAEVQYDGKARALLIRAFGSQAAITDRGVVTALGKGSITVRTGSGDSLTVRLDRNTRFRFLGAPAPRFMARPGAVVAVTHAQAGPAQVVNVLKRAGA